MSCTTRALLTAAALACLGVAMPLAQPKVPTPQSAIGFEPCADYKLATYEQIEDYFRKLAAAAPARIKLVDIGKTAEGRTQVLAIISSEDNLRQLEKYKGIGVRIEDDMLITRDGVKWMTAALPRSIADIEAFIAKARR